MKKSKSSLAVLLLLTISLFALTAITFSKLHLDDVSAASAVCPTGFAISVNNSSGTTTQTIVSGMANIIFGNSTTTAASINKVVILANNKPIGKAINSSTANYWNMPWATQLSPNGSYIIQAEVTLSSGFACNTAGVPVNIQNSTQANLILATQPQSWNGPMSFSFPISSNARVAELNFDVTNYAIFNYSTTIGSVNNTGNPITQYSSGQTVGAGEVSVNTTYGGRNITIKIPVKVGTASAPLPTTTSGSTTVNNQNTSTNTTATNTAVATTSQTSGGATQQQATTVARSAVLANNTTAQECAIAAIGKDKFNAINSGTARPTPEEFKKLNICFATSNFIVPSNFAPIAPKQIKDLPSTYNLTIAKLANEKVKKENQDKDALKISGKAAPNSTVILYVYSEPLVLVTTSDNDGTWTYTLEDPIEPGSHEVYAVVDRGDGVYQKSSPFDFIIGRAQASAENPNELSLLLANDPTPAQSNRNKYIYIGTSIAVILLAGGLVAFTLIKIRSHHKYIQSQINQNPTNQTNNINPPEDNIIRPNQNIN